MNRTESVRAGRIIPRKKFCRKIRIFCLIGGVARESYSGFDVVRISIEPREKKRQGGKKYQAAGKDAVFHWDK